MAEIADVGLTNIAVGIEGGPVVGRVGCLELRQLEVESIGT